MTTTTTAPEATSMSVTYTVSHGTTDTSFTGSEDAARDAAQAYARQFTDYSVSRSTPTPQDRGYAALASFNAGCPAENPVANRASEARCKLGAGHVADHRF